MKYQIIGQELEKVFELVSKVMNPLKKAESVLDRPSDEDLLFYDNVSMMDKLKVSERTLQRRRKNGEIRFIRFGGKIYYPKNFMVLPAHEPEVPEGEKDNIIPLNEFIKRYNTPRPRSRIIDVDRLAKRLTYFPSSEKTYTQKDMARLLQRTQIKRKKNHDHLKLWPKKIKLIGLPIKKN
ncbi:helix-turn-helix domain-containing protein [Cloacibacterium caeni]|uniref:helix-turn-helix domain-containing protein n=1 Tax=Cloacibacterium caeni TaxID=2004710 RepID=UPI001BCACC87|nr:helix-turn-helix domain-containing protein [Cloacibacterium caeni]